MPTGTELFWCVTMLLLGIFLGLGIVAVVVLDRIANALEALAKEKE